MKVRITKLPQAQSGLEVKMKDQRSGLGLNSNMTPWGAVVGKMSEPSVQVNSTLQPVPYWLANVEAEKGEVAMLPDKSGIPNTFKIGGNKHYNGGTPLNIPDDSFIFSDTPGMKIKDPAILKMFGTSSKSATPADLAKKYDINQFKKVLADPTTDKLQKETAEVMIANYNMKLAKLGLLQESKKGFPQGLPKIAMPYIESLNIDPSQFAAMNPQGEPQNTSDNEYAKYGRFMQKGGISEETPFINYSPGFSQDLPKEEEFRYNNPHVYTLYQKALESQDPTFIKKAASELESFDIPNSLQWIPWSDENKKTDLVSILKHKAETLSQPHILTQQEKDKSISDKAEGIYNYYNTLLKTTTDPVEQFQIKEKRDKLVGYTAPYKKNSYTDSSPIVDPINPGFSITNLHNMYSQSDIKDISILYDQMLQDTANRKKKTEVPVTMTDPTLAKKATSAKSDTVPSTKVSKKIVDKDGYEWVTKN